ncbi:MAG TPA: purine-nucleoside phosphorylase [Verrucomicrobiae bacterium]|nr:purine-nucleoside phosphorylase [Verrucomicrobiae bacterium]
MLADVKETKEFLESKIGSLKPEVALVIGSGLGGITKEIAKPVTIPYGDIPHFPKSTVTGHAGQMIFGEFAGKKLMVLSGRFHYYEGRSLAEITYPVHVVDALGVKILIVTNAAGGINPQYKPGDLMIIEDHINFMGVNPLLGNANGNGVKFIDMTQAYSGRLREKLDAAAEKLQMPIWRGVYLATTGPSYETPAEIKAFAWIGADAVGMSTVPEVIMARYHNIEVAGLSCITNLAAGISSKKLSHDEVLEVGRATQDKLGKLLGEFLGML